MFILAFFLVIPPLYFGKQYILICVYTYMYTYMHMCICYTNIYIYITYIILSINFVLYLYVCVLISVCVPHKKKPQEGAGVPGAEVTGIVNFLLWELGASPQVYSTQGLLPVDPSLQVLFAYIHVLCFIIRQTKELNVVNVSKK